MRSVMFVCDGRLSTLWRASTAFQVESDKRGDRVGLELL